MAYGNPMSQMADANKLSITQLQQALRDGTIDPQVGQLVLNSKIIADKKAKSAMQAQQPAPQPIVAQNAAYNPGVTGLPSNLPAQTMAGGGIIAFSGETDGSSVPVPEFDPNQSLSAKDYYNLPPSLRAQHKGKVVFTGLDSQKQYESAHDAPATQADYGSLAQDIGAVANRINPIRQVTDAAQELAARNIRGAGVVADRAVRGAGVVNQGMLDAARYTKSGLDSLLSRSGYSAPTPTAPARATQATRPLAESPDTPAMADNRYIDSLNPRASAAGDTSASGATKNTRSPTASNAGIGGLGYKPTGYDTSYAESLLKGDNNPETGLPFTRAELSARNRQEFIDAGGDPDVYNKEKAAAEKAGTKSEGKRKSDEAMPWFAVAKALGEAKPNEGLAGLLGKGAAAYGTEAGAITDKDELRAEAMRKELGQIALAQNTYSQAVASGNRDAIKQAKDDLEKHTTLIGAIKMKDTDAINEALKTGAQERTQVQVADIGAAASRYAADKAERSLNDQAAQIMADANKHGVTISKSEAYKQAQENAMPSYGAADARTQAGYQKEIDNLMKQKLTAFTPADKAAIDRRIEYYKSLLTAVPAGGAGAPAAAAPLYSSKDKSLDAIMNKYK